MSADSPAVSVIIPNYNYAKTLRACLESVYAQTLPPYEVIVVDDASTDRSREIAREFPCTLIGLPRNRGVSAARNAGVRASHGSVLFFLDSDEAVAPDALERAVALLAEDPGCGCVHGIIAKEPLIDDGPVERYRTLHAYFWRKRGVGLTPTAYFAVAAMPRAVFAAVGPFDETLRDSEDVEYSERLCRRYRIRLTDSVVAYHDEEHRLLPMLGEQFRRSQLLPSFAAAHRSREAALRANRTSGLLAACLAVAVLPMAAVAPRLAWVSATFLLLFAGADVPLARFVRRERGWRFLGFFLAVHMLVNLAIAAGAGWGFLRGLPRGDRARPAPTGLGEPA